MGKFLLVLIAVSFSLPALANDGGIAAIKVSQIKMREYKWDTQRNEEVEVRRINNPNFKIYIEGEEADKLQKILPSERSVITNMYPEIEQDFNAMFKSLGIYNVNVRDRSGNVLVSSKNLIISCNSGEMIFDDNGKPSLKQRGRSNCVISIRAVEEEHQQDDFGAVSPFDPAEVCQ